MYNANCIMVQSGLESGEGESMAGRTARCTFTAASKALIFSLALVNPLVTVQGVAEEQIQQFTLHGQDDCSDVGELYSRNVRNLQKVSPFVTCGAMKCFCNHYGVWSFSGRKNYRQSLLTPIKSGVTSMQIVGKKCFTRKLNWKYVQLLSIRHIGNSDAREPSLSLFAEPEYFGKELFVYGHRLALPTPQNFNSYGFTGNKSWTIFPNTNFTGNGTCLRPSTTELITHEANVSLTVGSMMQGCPKGRKSKFYRNATSSLTLYMESNSSHHLSFDGPEFRLPVPIEFIEFFMSGEDKWTIYAGTEFGGKTRCLTRFGQYLPGQLRKYRFKREPDYGETWMIGSVRRGCFPAPSITYPEYDARDYEDDDEEDEYWRNQRDELDWAIYVNETDGTLEAQNPNSTRKPTSILEDTNCGNTLRISRNSAIVLLRYIFDVIFLF